MENPVFEDLEIGTQLLYNPCPSVKFRVEIMEKTQNVFIAKPIEPNTRCHAVIIDESNLNCFQTL